MDQQQIKQLYEVIGRLYVDGHNANQMLTHFQGVIAHKDEEIKTLTGAKLDLLKELSDVGVEKDEGSTEG